MLFFEERRYSRRAVEKHNIFPNHPEPEKTSKTNKSLTSIKPSLTHPLERDHPHLHCLPRLTHTSTATPATLPSRGVALLVVHSLAVR
jgi:hypothetical protein